MFNRLALVFSVLIFFLLFTAPVFAQPFAYITNFGSNNVSVIDTATNTVTATVNVGIGPAGVAVHPSGKFVYVANFFENTVTVVSTESLEVTETRKVGSKPYCIAVHPYSGMVAVSNFGSPYLDVYSPNGQHTRIKVATSVANVYISPDGDRMFTTHWDRSFVSVIE